MIEETIHPEVLVFGGTGNLNIDGGSIAALVGPALIVSREYWAAWFVVRIGMATPRRTFVATIAKGGRLTAPRSPMIFRRAHGERQRLGERRCGRESPKQTFLRRRLKVAMSIHGVPQAGFEPATYRLEGGCSLP